MASLPLAATGPAYGQWVTVEQALAFIIPRGGAKSPPGRSAAMAYFATALFLGLFMVGPTYFGWADPNGRVSLALMTTFLLGAVAGYKSKG
jgi:hypothetical protein